MNITQFITSIDNRSGGTTISVTSLCSELVKLNVDTTLVTYNSANSIANQRHFDFNIKYLENLNESVFNTHQSLTNMGESVSKIYSPLSINSLIPETDIFHIQGIWQILPHRATLTARKYKKPYIISIRGMLAPFILKRHKLKKKIALSLYQLNDLKKANIIHATSLQEASDIRALGLKNRVEVIPNGIDINLFSAKSFIEKEKKKALFLSRIHKTKGLEYLIEAWTILKKINNDWDLEIVGNGDSSYIAELNKTIIKLGMERKITISKPVYNNKKIDKYHEADLFILPTYTENFGLVIAEACACGTPVITTKGAPWQELEEYNCGWWINIGVEPLVNTLKKVLPLSSKELFDIGKNGRKLIKSKYNMPVIAEQMIELYKSII